MDNAPMEVGIEPVNGVVVSRSVRAVTEPLVHLNVDTVSAGTKDRQLEFDGARTHIDVGQPIESKMSI
jgi:hypothetical protein